MMAEVAPNTVAALVGRPSRVVVRNNGGLNSGEAV
jgi:hypothetical protein